MQKMTRRDVCVGAAGLAAVGMRGLAQVHASEFPAPQSSLTARPKTPMDQTGAAGSAGGTMGVARAIALDQMAVRTMANGGDSRDIVHGTLATGETVNLHQSMQVVGAAANPAHAIQHSEFVLVREGTLEFQHEVDGKMVVEMAGPGGVIYVALGTKHALKNVGSVPAKYFVVAIGGDAR